MVCPETRKSLLETLEWLKAQVSAQGLTNVHFYPPVAADVLPDSLAMADAHVVIVGQRWSGVAFPAKFIAGIAAARPVLLLGPSDTELAGLVDSRRCGAVVSDGDALAEAAQVLERDPVLARRQGDAGRRLYEDQFDREKGLAGCDAVLG